MELAVFVGLQGSAKSTFFRERLSATHAHVSKDLSPRNRNKNRCQARLVEEALAAGGSVAVDNTNPRPRPAPPRRGRTPPRRRN